MNQLLLIFTVLLAVITSSPSSDEYVSLEKSNGNYDVPDTGSVKPVAKYQEQKLFVLQPEHPAYRLDGCLVRSYMDNTLLFDIKRPGQSVIVLKAGSPLIIDVQNGLKAQLRPGWDGTLGYSLYALDIRADAIGTGQITLSAAPIPAGTRQSIQDFNQRLSRFPGKPDAFRTWQQMYRDKLVRRLMNGKLPNHISPEAEVLYTVDHPLFTLRKLRYKSQPDRSNSLLLSIPKRSSGRVPVLIALHGHESAWGEADTSAFTAGNTDDFCAYFAVRGWAVLLPATMNHTLQHPGWTLQGEWTWDAMAALDYAVSLPEVDPRRVMVCGLSTGGHLAMNMMALDDRVSAGVIGCVLSTWHHYRERMRIPPHCDCGILGQLGDWLEQCDWAALAAPKPVQFQHGRKDAGYCPDADPSLLNPMWNTAVMPKEEFMAAFNEVEKAYKLTAGSENVRLHFHDEGHKVDNEAAYLFLMSVMEK